MLSEKTGASRRTVRFQETLGGGLIDGILCPGTKRLKRKPRRRGTQQFAVICFRD